MTTPPILIIAGSDSGGGAGIQADIKTVAQMGGFPTTTITALTAQNTRGVEAIHAVPADFIAQQMRVVLSDIGIKAIKTGMLFDANIITTIADTIREFAPRAPLVVDPVMVATSGDALLKDDAIDALRNELFPRATLLTPNLPEAEALTGYSIRTENDMVLAAATIARTGARAILIKGGHLPGDEVIDFLWDDGQEHWFRDIRIDSPHTHGSGCTLASGIATLLGHKDSLPNAVAKARAYVRSAIENAPGMGMGESGPMGLGSI